MHFRHVMSFPGMNFMLVHTMVIWQRLEVNQLWKQGIPRYMTPDQALGTLPISTSMPLVGIMVP